MNRRWALAKTGNKRAPQVTSKLILDFLGLPLRAVVEEIVGVKNTIAMEFIERAMVLVATALRGDADKGSRTATIFCRVRISTDLNS